MVDSLLENSFFSIVYNNYISCGDSAMMLKLPDESGGYCNLKREPEKQLDLGKFQIALDELLIHYRNAIRAAECLPGTVPADELIIELPQVS
jgi:hypothetical protein